MLIEIPRMTFPLPRRRTLPRPQPLPARTKLRLYGCRRVWRPSPFLRGALAGAAAVLSGLCSALLALTLLA
ncbi:MAG: hypothetical protein RIB41_09940 [Oceanibaculum nanhaiense]|jgi:hypothetical protein|uniref:hypothetical protein n=1 Tax=Oceanibaculum nanhaiense TaxID=1909734 RepID=UPI0032EE7ACE